jgi:DNA-binding NarL/FixJ family response regulator
MNFAGQTVSQHVIKVVLFDDNDMLRDSIAMLIRDTEDLVITGLFSDCIDVVKNIKSTKPDVVLMDIDMPGMSGITGVQLIRQNFPSVHVLMQTVFEDDSKVFAAIKAGASGYILKSAESTSLLEAIREVYNGGAPMTPSIAKKVLQHFQSGDAAAAKDEYRLTAREYEVLGYLVKGYSYKMIADKMSITYATVRAHMTKIYEKLHVSSMTEAVAKALSKKLF